MGCGLSALLLERHFAPEGGGWRILLVLRARAEFRVHNLPDDLPPPGRFDVVFCRNLPIRFDIATNAPVLDAVARRLAPDGVLHLGGAQSALCPTASLAPLPSEQDACGTA